MSTTSDITFEHNGHEYKVPKRHYSTRRQDAVFFYGGEFSNFVGGPFELRDYNGLRYLSARTTAEAMTFAKLDNVKDIARDTHLREYQTVEHYFAANKATTRDDHDWIADASSPWVAKKRGRGINLRPDWENVKFDVMLIGLRVKFADPHSRAVLLGTHDRFIAEDSPTDFCWGIRDAQGGYTGDNLLGKALMQVRDEIRREDENDN